MARAGTRDGVGGILILLALGLTFRVIIAYLLPGSGFANDLGAFRYWAADLAKEGLNGFYGRPFFHDYTPGYLYVLWLVGMVGQWLGGIGDLIKVPPILADLALAWLVWSMALELGAGRWAARLAALFVLINPITWFDSVAWGQVDSVGVVFLLLALRELWRDRPERSAVLTVIAAIIKPQLGILVPIVAVVTIRRALRPAGGFGDDGPLPALSTTTRWEAAVRGPIRIVTTGLAGFATAIAISLPFGLSLPGLVEQIFKTAGGYPYLSVNAWNPWALITQDGTGVAQNHGWVCDMVVNDPGFTRCPTGVMFGAIPAVAVGAALTVAAFLVVSLVVARRPDRLTMLVGVAVLALAFFVLPTRVHERYLYPLVAIGALLAAISPRWTLAYIVSSLATLANMYYVLTTLYPNNPSIDDWFRIGPTLGSWTGVAIAAAVQVAVLLFAFSELRGGATRRIAAELRADADSETDADADGLVADRRAADVLTRVPDGIGGVGGGPEPVGHEASSTGGDDAPAQDAGSTPAADLVPDAGPDRSASSPMAASQTAVAGPSRWAPRDGVVEGRLVGRPEPEWDERPSAGEVGYVGWLRSRLFERPIRRDRSRDHHGEGRGRIDRFDLWMVLVLGASLLTVRMWRLAEPYQMHFDEVYHARTATEFLQDWRYGIEHDIYEWTHPHLAKYAMAGGLVAWGDDRTSATSNLGVAVKAAAIEPRWDETTSVSRIAGDRLWVATGDAVRAYDLATRAVIVSIPVPGADAIGVDQVLHRIVVGTDAGELRVIDTAPLDAARWAGASITAEASPARAFTTLDAPVRFVQVTPDGGTYVAVIEPPAPAAGAGPDDLNAMSAVVVDAASASEVGRAAVGRVAQTSTAGTGQVAFASSAGLVILDTTTATRAVTLNVGGPPTGVAMVTGLDKDRLYVSYMATDGPRVATITPLGQGQSPQVETSFRLPGDATGWVGYDLGSMMVHVLGTRPDTGEPTVYVIEPHANAVYADAALPFAPSALAFDENQRYPSTDRQQILAFDAGGAAATIEAGKHAFAWRLPGVLAGVLMAMLLYLLARLLFRRREVALFLAALMALDSMLFAQSRIGMNDSYVGLGIVAAYLLFAAIWRSGSSRRAWIAFTLGMPAVGVMLGFALASKWVAAYAIGSLGILVLARSALGRLILISGLVLMTTVLGYMGLSVPAGQSGGNYLFMAIMVALTLAAAVANVLHPIAWTDEEERLLVYGPAVLGAIVFLASVAAGVAGITFVVGPIAVSPQQLAFALVAFSAVAYSVIVVVGRWGFGPRAGAPSPEDPASLLPAPAEAPEGWLRPGMFAGLPMLWALACLVVLPVALYVVSYIPWALINGNLLWANLSVAGHQIAAAWPPNHAGQTLVDLTQQMYRYHNTLSAPHAASSPWWAWAFDFKPVWFYQESFAGGTSAAIYDAGNLVIWWMAIPAMAFAAWQAFVRRSPALALIVIAFACQWISWSRIDRAAFQYHYYTSLPFVFLALAYFMAELWHGASRRTWLLARLAGAAAILAPTTLWLFHRPLCGFVRVDDVNPDSRACPTLIPDFVLSGRALGIALVVGVGVLILVRLLLALGDDDGSGGSGGSRGVGARLRTAALAAVGVSVGFFAVSTFLDDTPLVSLHDIPVEPIALAVTLALLPLASFVATARDARRFVAGMLAAIATWFVLWYPNVSALPLPTALSNAYQGLLPTYVYPFQFPVSTVDRSGPGPKLFALEPALLLLALIGVVLMVSYASWVWRITAAEEAAGPRGAEGDASGDGTGPAAGASGGDSSQTVSSSGDDPGSNRSDDTSAPPDPGSG